MTKQEVNFITNIRRFVWVYKKTKLTACTDRTVAQIN